MKETKIKYLEEQVKEAKRDYLIAEKHGNYETYEFYRDRYNKIRQTYNKELKRLKI